MKKKNYKLIKVGLGKNRTYAKVSNEDYKLCCQYTWWVRNSDKYTYPMTTIGNKSVALHRVVLGLVDAPKTTYVDHINGDRLDNTRENLRICNNAQNQWNTPKKANSKQKYKGVRKTKSGKYEARIRYKGERFRLGVYPTIEEAVRVYNDKALELHGEFAYINKLD